MKVSPYVGIIQIRLRVRAIQPTLSLLYASSPCERIHYTTFRPVLQGRLAKHAYARYDRGNLLRIKETCPWNRKTCCKRCIPPKS